MSIETKTLCEKDIELVYSFEKGRDQNSELSEMEREMLSWSTPWRREALEFYLPNGWCFGFFDKETDQLHGYFLAQPLCFFRGLTQTLWLEHLSSDSSELTHQMVDVAYRLCRSKHLQSLLAYRPESYMDALNALNAVRLEEDYYLIKTTKF